MSAPVVIDQPGVYDLPAETYHRDPVPGGSLSSTGAKKLLAPSCPALFRHWQLNGQDYRPEFEFGHAAHTEILGVGAPIAIIDAEDWRTAAAKDGRDAARRDGKTPLLLREWEQVQDMADAVRAHPTASKLFQPGAGKPEQSLFWVDQEFGVWRRAMLDWLPNSGAGPFIVDDLKSANSVEPGHLSKALYEYGYAQQAAWYIDGVEALGLSGDFEPVFLLVFVMKTPPYLITVAQPTPEAIQWGRVLNRKALDTYRLCVETGHWPGYADGVISLSFPGWVERQLEAAFDRGDLDPITLTEAPL